MSDRPAARQIRVTPGDAFSRAVELLDRGDVPGAEKIYRAILRQYPNHFETLANLGFILLTTERMEEAARLFRKALNQKPNAAVVHTQLARALQMLDRHAEALERAGRAIALDPGQVDAHETLATILSDLGRYDEALRSLARAMDLAPDRPRSYYLWGQMTHWAADEPRLARLEALGRHPQAFPLENQVYLHFALAKAYSDRGDTERAFLCQAEGGALHRRMFKYDEAATHREMTELCQAFDLGWMQRHQDIGDASTLPVFIVGMPRSGTSLVEQILASHPKVRALGERGTFNEALATMCGMHWVPPSIAQRAAAWPDADLRKLAALYLQAIRRDVPGAALRVTDKLPANFKFVGLIHGALPNARIIHVRRDPIDTCLSMFSILFSGLSHLHSYDLGELGRYYRAYAKMMAHWHGVLPPGIMLDVQYEDVVADIEFQAHRIVAHCGLDWNAACLEY
jgi:hypothetical protein